MPDLPFFSKSLADCYSPAPLLYRPRPSPPGCPAFAQGMALGGLSSGLPGGFGGEAAAAGKARQLRAFSLWPVQASLAVTQKQNSQEPVQRRSGASRVRSGARSALPDNPDARCGAIAGRRSHAELTVPV